MTSPVQIAEKVLLDATVYTPIWCAWFLLFMEGTKAVLKRREDEGKNKGTFGETWLELYKGNLGFFLPLTSLIYGFVDVEGRVLAFGLASLLYTTVLSLWNAERGGDEGDVGDVLCLVPDDDSVSAGENKEECSPIGVPTRSTAMFNPGVRRIGVRAKWGVRKLSKFDLDEFLDTPFFEPDKVSDKSPMKWFADLLVDDYEKAEIIYVGAIFAVLIGVGQAWLREEYHNHINLM